MFVSMLWAASPIIKKPILNTLPTETVMVLVSFAYAVTVFTVVLIFRKQVVISSLSKLNPQIGLNIVILVILCGLFPNYVYNLLLKSNDAHITTSLVSVTPLFVLLFSVVFLKEKVTLLSACGVLMIFAGVVLLNQAVIQKVNE